MSKAAPASSAPPAENPCVEYDAPEVQFLATVKFATSVELEPSVVN